MFKLRTYETWQLSTDHPYYNYIYIRRLPSGKFRLCYFEDLKSVNKINFQTPEEAFSWVEGYRKNKHDNS